MGLGKDCCDIYLNTKLYMNAYFWSIRTKSSKATPLHVWVVHCEMYNKFEVLLGWWTYGFPYTCYMGSHKAYHIPLHHFLTDIGHITLATTTSLYCLPCETCYANQNTSAFGASMLNMAIIVWHFYAVRLVYLRGCCYARSTLSCIDFYTAHSCSLSWVRLTKHIHIKFME